MKKRAMLIANSASFIDHFNKDNIAILKSLGYDITVAANFKEGNSSTDERIADFTNELRKSNIDIIDLPIPRKVTELVKTQSAISALKKYLAKHPCAIIHTQTPFGGVVGRIAARTYRKKGISKVIYFVHGFHFFKGAAKKNYLVYYNIEKYLSKFTDCLITLNHEDFEAATKDFGHKNTRYVPGVGVDTDYINTISVDIDAKKKELSLPTDKKIILTVAELIPRKNIETAIRAFANMKHTDTVLVICGKGALLEPLNKLCYELKIDDRVYFPGYRTDILEIYHIADVFLFTSFQEGLSVAVMQAMAAGLPIVASRIRGDVDLLSPYSDCPSAEYLIDVNDVDSFTDRLDYLLNNPDIAKKLGEINYQNCKKYFDINFVHQQMTDIYMSLSE